MTFCATWNQNKLGMANVDAESSIPLTGNIDTGKEELVEPKKGYVVYSLLNLGFIYLPNNVAQANRCDKLINHKVESPINMSVSVPKLAQNK